MNYSESRVRWKQELLVSSRRKIKNRIRVWFVLVGAVLVIGVILITSFCVAGMLRGLCDSAPAVSSLDMMPEGYATTIYDVGHNKIQTLIGSDANREYVELSNVPENVQHAFVAIEDARFYEHYGVDMKGILRAIYSGISKEEGLKQGASTITQQLLKNQVFGGGNEKTFFTRLSRKVKEQYLAVQLENEMSKEQILEYYLNTINLGQNTLGIQTASKRYFNKDISQVTLSESAVLASIAQNPKKC